jgi:protein-tyrosine phosphatase
VSAGLSVLFLVVYGGCNWITSQRNDIGIFYFEWERAIPFVPFMILPYMSIDLFFVGAPFLCATDRELRLFSRRVTAAILIGGICFLLFPLRFAFLRPHASGWTGALFDWFRGLDAPYNLLPSLHAALWMILVPIYLRHSRGLLRGAVMLWLALVGLSPVLTHQHHLIDIMGGFALAGYCFYFFQEPLAPPPLVKNERIGGYYMIGAVTLLGCAALFWPVGALLLWPTLSLVIVAAAYFGLGPAIFRKTNGILPSSTWFVLGPCLAGQYLSLLHYRRQCRLWDEISPNVWIGRKLNNREAVAAVHSGVAAVVDLSAEFSEAKAFRAIIYKDVPVLDLTAPTPEQLREMGSFIRQQSKHGIVYVHCKIGYSRSAAAVAAYLIMSGEVRDVAEATSIIRRARPSVIIRPEVMTALSQFENHFRDQNSGPEPFLLASRKSDT